MTTTCDVCHAICYNASAEIFVAINIITGHYQTTAKKDYCKLITNNSEQSNNKNIRNKN